MLILAIDTALDACQAGVIEPPDRIVAEETIEMTRGHAEALMPLLARMMDRAELSFSDLDRITVTVGPGSFTGLRVGIAAARGIALASGKPAIGVSTLAALAAPYLWAERLPVVAAIDARHDHIYFERVGQGGRVVMSPRVMPLIEAVRGAKGAAIIVGSAAEAIARDWPEGVAVPGLDRKSAPSLAAIARLGAAANPAYAVPKPLYLRPADARPQDSARLPRR
jgi:tRNA threonylcarbamoyl adenosine modification protein YeaZ